MKLYIIDDDDLIHSLYRLHFKQLVHGFEAESFYNGLEAIRTFEERSTDGLEMPDIVLLDINMPVMGGKEFLDQFELVAPSLKKIPSIFILSSCLLEDELMKRRKYVVDVFTKPLTKEIVQRMIVNQIEYE
ncbi:MAG: response regulator [Cytophagales bacterium]|nr:response regulator [Cytophagales bacterium]